MTDEQPNEEEIRLPNGVWAWTSCPIHLNLFFYFERFLTSKITLHFSSAAKNDSSIDAIYCQTHSLHQPKRLTLASFWFSQPSTNIAYYVLCPFAVSVCIQLFYFSAFYSQIPNYRKNWWWYFYPLGKISLLYVLNASPEE